MERRRRLPAAARRAPRPPALRAARRPAVRQRPAPHRPRRQQDPEGHDRQGAPARRLRRALHAGLGLPRPADRERRSRRPSAAACRAPRCRRKSRAYATEQIAQQMADFKRLGVLGDWEHPYRTMDFGNEAGEIRVLKRVIERGFVYRGLKPVYWCFDCGSSLAEFEIEYADRKSTTVDVAFLRRRPRRARRRVRPALDRQGRLRRHLDDDAVDAPGEPGAEPEPGARVRARRHRARPARAGERAGREVPRALRPRGPRASRRRRARSSTACASTIRSPPSTPATTASRRSTSPTTRPPRTAPASSTRRRPTASTTSTRAAPTAWRSTTSSTRCRATASTRTRCRCSAARTSGRRTPAIVDALRDAGRLLASGDARAQLPALLAPQDAGDLPRRGAVVRAHGRGRRLDPGVFAVDPAPQTLRADARSTRSTRPRSIPRTAAPGCTT